MSCNSAILHTASGRSANYRVVLGVVSIPPPFLAQVIKTTEYPSWPYWHKAGVAIRGGAAPVTITVPPALRGRVAIGWGSTRPVSTVTFARCPAVGKPWNAYAGGFHLRAHSACVPMQITVGNQRRLVHVGVGRRC